MHIIEGKALNKIASEIKKGGIELTNPDFLSHIIQHRQGLLAKVEHIVSDFISGAASYPETWWAATIQLAAISGFLGEKQYAFASIRENILASIIWVALQDLWKAIQVLEFLLEKHIENDPARMFGRYAGSIYTNYYLFRGLGKGLQRSAKALNFVYASFGAAIMTIATGYNTLGPIVTSIVTGDYSPVLFKDLSKLEFLGKEKFEYNPHSYKEFSDLLKKVQQLNVHHGRGFYLVPTGV